MGRRAKKAPVVTKKRVKLAKLFKCPFCANEQVVECKMDYKNSIGSLSCRLCGAAYQMPIHRLHEPIDIFSEWLDDCEAAENNNNNPTSTISTVAATSVAGGGSSKGTAASVASTGVPQYDDDDDEDDIPASSNIQRRVNNNNNKKSGPSSFKNDRNNPSIDLGDGDSDEDDDDDDM